MEFNEKLQELRKQKGLTQEELASALFVSRTAVSKWESGRGYPNLDSLRAIAKLFSITIDELLSGEELISLAEEDKKQNKRYVFNTVFGLLDLSIVMFLFLPFLGENVNGAIYEVPLLQMSQISPYLRISYFAFVVASVLLGISTLTIPFSTKAKTTFSVILSVAGVLLFTVSRQPYAAVFLFVFLLIKLFLLIKKK